jgi:hypothetical protein
MIISHANLVKRVTYPLRRRSQALPAGPSVWFGTLAFVDCAITILHGDYTPRCCSYRYETDSPVAVTLGAAWLIASLGVFRDIARASRCC